MPIYVSFYSHTQCKYCFWSYSMWNSYIKQRHISSYICLCCSISLRMPQPPSEWYDMEQRHQATSRAAGCPHGPTTPLLPPMLPVTGIDPAYQTVAINLFIHSAGTSCTPLTRIHPHCNFTICHIATPLHLFTIYRKLIKSTAKRFFH